MAKKTKATSGADEKTPSLPQYFSWINSTNEGSTEEQTVTNLEYFKWLHDKYGMKLKIYAWDAGNLDGAGYYDNPNESERLKKQYPRGYKPCVDKAAEFGCHLGVWGGADGYGNTPEEEAKRHELLVSLCRDLGFMQFKFDAVCGWPREEKHLMFKKTMDECRRYVPELIVLNHRLWLGEGEIAATTYLVEGVETYIDVHTFNEISGPHHRMAPLTRPLVPGLKRLAEDHGVCISSCIDYFEDDLIVQAFSRCLILAPEIYGNPWLMRDDEQARLAKIYNVHAKYADILVNAFPLSEAIYGKNAVSRGDGDTRLLTFTNASWEAKTVTFTVGEEIALSDCDGKEYIVKAIHPYEEYIATAKAGEKVSIEIEPARAALILVQEKSKFMFEDFVLTGCKYETVYGPGAEADKVRIYKADGQIGSIGKRSVDYAAINGNTTIARPVSLGLLKSAPVPANMEQLYEATCFAADTDSLEYQSLKRSGETKIPEVKAARDAFFNQESYIFRGTEARAMFDGNKDTFFDTDTKYRKTRLEGGCLRVDLGDAYDISRVEIETFSVSEPDPQLQEAHFEPMAQVSPDLANWTDAPLLGVAEESETSSIPTILDFCHFTKYREGKRCVVTYTVNSKARYFRLPSPMDRIFSFTAYDMAGNKIDLTAPHANNTLAPFDKVNFISARALTVKLPEEYADGAYIAIGTDGVHGVEGVYCAMEFDGQVIGAYDRACSYPFNNWEYIAPNPESGFTYYFRLTPEMKGKEVKLHAFYKEDCQVVTGAWVCDANNKQPIAELNI